MHNKQIRTFRLWRPRRERVRCLARSCCDGSQVAWVSPWFERKRTEADRRLRSSGWRCTWSAPCRRSRRLVRSEESASVDVKHDRNGDGRGAPGSAEGQVAGVGAESEAAGGHRDCDRRRGGAAASRDLEPGLVRLDLPGMYASATVLDREDLAGRVSPNDNANERQRGLVGRLALQIRRQPARRTRRDRKDRRPDAIASALAWGEKSREILGYG